jgi:hypothetical protein
MRITATLACVLAIAGIVTLSAPAEAKLATNKLATNKLATNKLATNSVTTNRAAWGKPRPLGAAAEGAFTGVSEITLPSGVRLNR